MPLFGELPPQPQPEQEPNQAPSKKELIYKSLEITTKPPSSDLISLEAAHQKLLDKLQNSQGMPGLGAVKRQDRG